MMQGVSPRMVKAATYLRWWQGLNARESALPEEMTDAEWFRRGQEIRVLLNDLVEVGQVAGAVLPFAQHKQGSRMAIDGLLNPGFDWQDGEIDMQGTFWPSEFDRASGLIARLVKITGIPE